MPRLTTVTAARLSAAGASRVRSCIRKRIRGLELLKNTEDRCVASFHCMAQATRERERLEAMKRILVGRPMATGEMEETLLSKFLALPIFASDPLSSVAYATEAALVVLVGVSLSASHLVLPVSGAIATLLLIVALSYRQTV